MPNGTVTAPSATPRAAFPYTIAAIAGVALWIGASVISGKREPWDAGVYWTVVYPIAIALSFLLGYFYPQRPWRWPLTLFLFQFVGMAIRNGEVGNLWPLGLALFAVLSIPGILMGKLSSWLRARLESRAS